MKLKVISVTKSTGISKKTNRPFEILNLSTLSEFEMVNTESYQREGSGFSVVEIPVSNSFFAELDRKMGEVFKGQPIDFDFETSLTSRGTIITGFASK